MKQIGKEVARKTRRALRTKKGRRAVASVTAQ